MADEDGADGAPTGVSMSEFTTTMTYEKGGRMEAGEDITMGRMVEDLIEAISKGNPTVHRALSDVLAEIDSLDSLYPIRPGNPLKDMMEKDR